MQKNIIILLSSVLIVSVYFNFSGGFSSKDNVSDFEQKQKCAVYKKQIEDKFEKNNYEAASEGVFAYDNLKEVFYSPKANSCLYIYEMSGGLGKNRFLEIYLRDALSGVSLSHATTHVDGKYNLEAEVAFNMVVDEYKTIKE